MCEHLIDLDRYIKSKNIAEIFRGQAWSENCREWVYYDCILDIKKLKKRFNFGSAVAVHKYCDIKVGDELGFYCKTHQDAVMGFSPNGKNGKGKAVIK